jgi:hypothetical protein
MFYSIEGVFHVNFDYHSFFFVHDTGVDCFLDQDYVVPYFSFGHKTALIWNINSWEEKL